MARGFEQGSGSLESRLMLELTEGTRLDDFMRNHADLWRRMENLYGAEEVKADEKRALRGAVVKIDGAIWSAYAGILEGRPEAARRGNGMSGQVKRGGRSTKPGVGNN